MTNLTDANLADAYAAAKAAFDAANAQLELLKAEVRERGKPSLAGSTVLVKLDLRERASLDTAAVKALLTPEQFAAVSRSTVYPVVTIKPLLKVAA